MPIDFLSDEQAAAYGSFGSELPEADLHRFFFLDDKDRFVIAFAVRVRIPAGKRACGTKQPLSARNC